MYSHRRFMFGLFNFQAECKQRQIHIRRIDLRLRELPS